MEIFDISDINKENTTKETKHKKMAIRKPVESGIAIIYDKGYIDNNLVNDVKELQKLINNKIEAGYEVKKSLEFPDVLTICITVIGTNFLSGFLSKAGSDFWDCLKKIIKKNLILPNEKIYNFCFNINDEVEIMLVFTAPEPNDILDSLKNTQTLIEQHVTNYLVKNSKVRRIVFEYSKGKYTHLYSVYNDGTPFDISDIDKYKKILNSVKDT